MVHYANNKLAKHFFHDTGAALLNFIFEAIPFVVFSLVIGLLWLLGIAIFAMTSISFF